MNPGAHSEHQKHWNIEDEHSRNISAKNYILDVRLDSE